MFGLSSVRYGSFLVRVNFRSIISGLSSGRISVHSVRVIRVGSLLPDLLTGDSNRKNSKMIKRVTFNSLKHLVAGVYY